jgi:hypothetical protein
MAQYRHQLAAGTGVLTDCPTCAIPATQYSVCFSNVDTNGLCCGTSYPATVWIPTSENYVDALIFWADEAMTVRAAVGFYSNNLTAGCAPANSNIKIQECFTGSSSAGQWNTLNTNGFVTGNYVSFEPNTLPGTTKCGIVIDDAYASGNEDATIIRPSGVGGCEDTAHNCPPNPNP